MPTSSEGCSSDIRVVASSNVPPHVDFSPSASGVHFIQQAYVARIPASSTSTSTDVSIQYHQPAHVDPPVPSEEFEEYNENPAPETGIFYKLLFSFNFPP